MPKLREQEIAHLGFVQGVISRMATNSFAMKALAVTSVTAVIALYVSKQGAPKEIILSGFLPVVVFWWLDAKYLRLEKLYRKLYDAIRSGDDVAPFDLNWRAYDDKVEATIKLVLLNWSVSPLYIAISLILIIIAFI